MPTIGSLFASLTLESASFMSGMKAAQKELRQTQAHFAETGKKLVTVGAVMTAGITAPFAALIATAMPAAQESRLALAQVNAALASMGPVAGRTSAQLQGLAGHLQDISLYDDDDILKSVTANMLAFGNISGQAFDRAQLAAVNLSARLGKDLQSSALLVGKALNNPVKGLGALTKAGVSFTAQQQTQIKTMAAAGDMAGAQGLILAELEKKFRGAAKAARDATPGADSQQAWRTLQEKLGEIGLKVLPPLTAALTRVLNVFSDMPDSVQVGVIGLVGFSAAIGPVLTAIGGLTLVIGKALPVMKALAIVVRTTAIPAIIEFGVILLPILAPLAAVAGAVALVVAAVNHWDQIKAVANRVVSYMAGLYAGVKAWIGDKLTAVFDGIKGKLKAVGDWFYNLYDRVVGHSYVPDMIEGIAAQMARLDKVMVDPARRATETAAEHFRNLAAAVQPIMDRLFPQAAADRQFQSDLATLNESQAAGQIDGQASAALISEHFAPQLDAITAQVNAAGDAVIAKWEGNGGVVPTLKAANDELGKSFADIAQSIAQSLGGLANAIKHGDWLGALQGVLSVVTQLGQAGVFGKTIQAQATQHETYAGARASGGPVLAGMSYLVGERGPELLRMGGSSGSIIPNHALGGAANDRQRVAVHVEPSPLFNVVVNQVSGAQANTAVRRAGAASASANARRLG